MRPPVALYRLFNADGGLLYVGITWNLGHRFTQHSQNQPWWPAVASRTVEMHDNRQLARIAELTAIYDEEPPFNIDGMWDGHDRDLKALPTVDEVEMPANLVEQLWVIAGKEGSSFCRVLTRIVASAIEEAPVLDPDRLERFRNNRMEILSTRVSRETLALLDEKRGEMSRAEALRRAIDVWADPTVPHPVAAPEPEPEVVEEVELAATPAVTLPIVGSLRRDVVEPNFKKAGKK